LLLAHACDLLDDLVVNVRIGDDQAASRIGVAQTMLHAARTVERDAR
jgi:hypothetical protein